jgi:host factor-I protein
MAQATEPRAASAPSNIQSVFLNYARRERLSVSVHLIDGRQFDARIKNFDRFAVVVEVDGSDHLVFKHAIATIATERSVTNYVTPQQQ